MILCWLFLSGLCFGLPPGTKEEGLFISSTSVLAWHLLEITSAISFALFSS